MFQDAQSAGSSAVPDVTDRSAGEGASARPSGWARGLGVAAVLLAYVSLAHFSNLHPEARALGVTLALAPLAGGLLLLLWRTGRRLATICLALLGALLLARWWTLLATHFAWLYLAQQTGFYALLGLMFGRSLAAGSEPLCSRLARMLHGALSPALARYTRQITVVWALLFAAITATHVVLFLMAPLAVWSLFANFLCLPLIAATFVVEYIVRCQVLPKSERATLLDGVRAFTASSSAPDPGRRR